jgi:hypothetical protein
MFPQYEVLQGTQPYHSANDGDHGDLKNWDAVEAGNTLRRDYYGMKHQHVNFNYIFTYFHIYIYNIYILLYLYIYIIKQHLKTITYVKKKKLQKKNMWL